MPGSLKDISLVGAIIALFKESVMFTSVELIILTAFHYYITLPVINLIGFPTIYESMHGDYVRFWIRFGISAVFALLGLVLAESSRSGNDEKLSIFETKLKDYLNSRGMALVAGPYGIVLFGIAYFWQIVVLLIFFGLVHWIFY